MTEVFAFDDGHVERYADVLSSVARALARSDRPGAAAALEPIAGDVWHGRLKLSGSVGPGGLATGTRSVSDRLRAEVFARDGFRCVYCGRRAVPRCVLVALSDVFPGQIAYHPNYARGKIHPVFWALAPEMDHVLAHSRGGANDLGNLATLHTACNARKSDSLSTDLPVLERPAQAGGWDGLVGLYPAVVAAIQGGGREDYHARWLRQFALVGRNAGPALGATTTEAGR